MRFPHRGGERKFNLNFSIKRKISSLVVSRFQTLPARRLLSARNQEICLRTKFAVLFIDLKVKIWEKLDYIVFAVLPPPNTPL